MHLEQIPENWEIKPFWSISKQKSIIGNEDLDLLSVYLTKGVINFSDVKEKRTNVTSDDKSKYQRVDPGDLVMNNQQAWRGSVGVSNLLGIVSPAYYVFKISECFDQIYANYLFRDKFMVSQYLTSSKGVGSIQRNLFYPSLRIITVPIPPIPEQKLIAKYLDKKTKNIDLLVQKIEEKIELLEEQINVLTNKFVTKGIYQSVEMKESGIESIGKIPKHWLVSKINLVSELVTDGSHHSPPSTEEGKNYITVSNITSSKSVDFSNCSKISVDSFIQLEKEGCRPTKGDILITKDGTIGRGCVVDENDFVFLSSIGLVRLKKGNNPFYFLEFLLSIGSVQEMFSNIRGAGITRLTINLIKNLPVLLPPSEEQQLIVERINKEVKPLKKLIEMHQKKIFFLNEYRESIINSAVTGKIFISEDMV